MRQYFCQCFNLLLVNDLKLIFLPLSNEKNLPTPLHIVFHSFSLLFVQDLKLGFSPAPQQKKSSYAPVLTSKGKLLGCGHINIKCT